MWLRERDLGCSLEQRQDTLGFSLTVNPYGASNAVCGFAYKVIVGALAVKALLRRW